MRICLGIIKIILSLDYKRALLGILNECDPFQIASFKYQNSQQEKMSWLFERKYFLIKTSIMFEV